MTDLSNHDQGDWVGALYDQYASQLFRYAVMVLADPAAAADAVQQVFLGLLRRQGDRPNCDERYLRRAVRNECFTLLRQGRRRHRDLAAPVLESLEDGASIEERVILEEALRRLPPDQREVVHLKIFEGLTFREIGDLTEESINTVASRYRYAMEKLRDCLEPGEP